MQAIERINLPKPDTHCFDDDTKSDVWSYSPELVREIVLAHIDALTAENEQLRKDAERYQWLTRTSDTNQLMVCDTDTQRLYFGYESDAAIDAARKGTP